MKGLRWTLCGPRGRAWRRYGKGAGSLRKCIQCRKAGGERRESRHGLHQRDGKDTRATWKTRRQW